MTTTSIPSNTSKSSACRCDQNCGCCLKKAIKPKQGILAKRPWLLIIALFSLMLCAWTVMIYLAATHQPKSVPFSTAADARQH